MGCNCNSGVRTFRVEVDGNTWIINGLDQIIFSTILVMPSSEEEARKELWEAFQVLNQVEPGKESEIQDVLLKIYKDSKKAYDEYEQNRLDRDEFNERPENHV